MGGFSPSSYGNYQGGGLDFSSYQTSYGLPPQAKYVNPKLNLGQQQRSTGYGNYAPPELDLQNPQGQSSSTGSHNYAGAIPGALGLAATTIGMANQGFHYGSIPTSQYDSNSAPSYTAGQLENQVLGSHPHGAQTGEILGGISQGASAGSSFGPVGTAIGAGVGAVATIFGGEARKRHEEQQKAQAAAQVTQAQQQFNAADVNYRNQQNQLYNYYNQNNEAGREYNVYRSRI